MVLNREVTTGEPEETSSTSQTEKAVDETTSTSSTKTKKKAFDETTSSTEVEKEDETTDEDDVKKAGLEQSPSESATANSKAGNTVTPGKMTGQAQDVFVPSSNVDVGRMGQGKTPGQESYSGKSVNPDLLKSPLFVELNKSIDSFGKTLSKKVEAMEKSTQARLDNLGAQLEKLEKFYSSPFYKSVQDTPENAPKGQSVAERIGSGAVKFSG